MYCATCMGPVLAIRRRISASSGDILVSTAMVLASLLNPNFARRVAAWSARRWGSGRSPLGKENEAGAREHQRDRKQHSHGEAAPEESKLHIRFAEELTEEPGKAVRQCENSRHHAGAPQRAGPYRDREQGHQH